MEMIQEYDVVIVGAGPAGLQLARQFIDTDYKVLVLDKKKNPQDVAYNTSGTFMNPDDFSLPSSVFHPIHSCVLSSKHKTIEKHGKIAIIDRKCMLQYLHDDCSKSTTITLLYGVIVNVISDEGSTLVSYKSGSDKEVVVSGKVFVDASGNGQVFAKHIGLQDTAGIPALGVEYIVPLLSECNTTDLFIGSDFAGGYGRIFPKNDKEAIIGFGTFEQNLFRNIDTYLDNMRLLPRVQQRCEKRILAKHYGVLRTGQVPKKFVHGNVVLLGDCVLQANPIVGEGVRFVLDAATMASGAIKQFLETGCTSSLTKYERDRKEKYVSSWKRSYYLQQHIWKLSKNDARMDFGVDFLNTLSDENFMKVIGGNISFLFFVKISLISFWGKLCNLGIYLASGLNSFRMK